ncbi:MAG: hypothetical protein IIA75_00990 [Proteobacteria bacterium]|nr:hypothetical protein [Pseudomonadota bacterium]
MNELVNTERTQVHRVPILSVKERAVLHQIINESMICHVGFTDKDHPFVIPILG